jgi:hypothetical protein
MPGWIKFGKDLRTDPAVLRIAAKVGGDVVTHDRYISNARVTLVLGALAQLWMIADSHVSDDDVLALGVEHINEIIGIPNFCDLLPRHWLEVLDSDHVRLPKFQEHNGPAAKVRAMTAKRVTVHRYKNVSSPLPNSTPTVTDALPDLVLEKSKRKRKSESKTQSQIQTQKNPPSPLKPKKKISIPISRETVPGLDVNAWEEWCHYRRERKPAIRSASMLAAAKDMARLGVLQRAAVDHSMAQGYQGLIPPKANGNGIFPHAAPVNHAAEIDALRKHAHEIGFRAPFEHESPAAYRTSMNLWEQKPPQYREAFNAPHTPHRQQSI